MAQISLKCRLIWTAVPAVLLVVLLAADANGQRGRADSVLSVRGRITLLAADGNRAAVSTRVKPGCGRIVVWRGGDKRAISVKPGILGCAGDGVSQLGLGAARVAWIEQGGGNTLELSVKAAKLTGGPGRELEFATNGDRAGADPAGDWVGRLFGGGSVLAYNSWTQVCDRPTDEECGQKDPFLRVTDQKLVRVVAGRRAVIAQGDAAYPLLAVGGSWMAVGTANNLTIRRANGAETAAILDPAGSARQVALSTTRLAIETTTTLDLHDPATGAAGKSLPLGAAASLRLVGVSSRLALLRGPHRLVLVRLSDGKRISFPLGASAAATLVGGRLTETGLFYAYNTRSAGRIVFEPTARLLARF